VSVSSLNYLHVCVTLGVHGFGIPYSSTLGGAGNSGYLDLSPSRGSVSPRPGCDPEQEGRPQLLHSNQAFFACEGTGWCLQVTRWWWGNL
jgi:hypothetical protein